MEQASDQAVQPATPAELAEAGGQARAFVTAVKLHDLLIDHPDVWDFLQQLAEFTAETLSTQGTTYCGVTLQKHRNQQMTVGSSDAVARQMDEVQYDYDDGPCLHALRVHAEVFISDVRAETRWPEFMEHISRHGVGAMFCLPLDLEGSAKAAVNLYGADASIFTETFKEVARTFAEQASRALRLAVRVAQHATAAEDLHSILESRTEIDLAVGILMGQNRCSQKEAFSMLRTASNGRNIKVKVLAADMVAKLNGTPATPHFERG